MNSSSYSLENDISNDAEKKWMKLPVTETPLTRAELIADIEGITNRFPELFTVDFTPSTIAYDQQNPRKRKLALMAIVLSTVRELLITNNMMNRRALYYKLKNGKTVHLAKSQGVVDKAVNSVADLLNCSPWKLHLIPTCTSLVAGDITFFLANNVVIDCSTSGDTLIPHMAFDVKSIRTRAKLVLVVEKDTVFQQLVKRDCTRLLNCILITGKGYPDMNARMLVNKLCEEMCLPTYIFVDSDPYGIHIMLVYRYGSSTLARENNNLASPSARWLGVFPSELRVFGAKTLPLTERDSAKLKFIGMKMLPLTEQDSSTLRSTESQLKFKFGIKEKILREMSIMGKGKAEIESVISCFPPQFFVNLYLKCKIEGADCI